MWSGIDRHWTVGIEAASGDSVDFSKLEPAFCGGPTRQLDVMRARGGRSGGDRAQWQDARLMRLR
jgi:hypothetical protein